MSALSTLFAAASAALASAGAAASPPVAVFVEGSVPDGRTWETAPGIVIAQPSAFEGVGSDKDADATAVLLTVRCYGPLAETLRQAALAETTLLALDATTGERAGSVPIPNRTAARYTGRAVSVRLTVH